MITADIGQDFPVYFVVGGPDSDTILVKLLECTFARNFPGYRLIQNDVGEY